MSFVARENQKSPKCFTKQADENCHRRWTSVAGSDPELSAWKVVLLAHEKPYINDRDNNYLCNECWSYMQVPIPRCDGDKDIVVSFELPFFPLKCRMASFFPRQNRDFVSSQPCSLQAGSSWETYEKSLLSVCRLTAVMIFQNDYLWTDR